MKQSFDCLWYDPSELTDVYSFRSLSLFLDLTIFQMKMFNIYYHLISCMTCYHGWQVMKLDFLKSLLLYSSSYSVTLNPTYKMLINYERYWSILFIINYCWHLPLNLFVFVHSIYFISRIWECGMWLETYWVGLRRKWSEIFIIYWVKFLLFEIFF